jgi:ABC-2 type transport system permease protein
LRLARILRVIQRVGTGFYRDPRALWAILFVPIGTLLLVGYVMRSAHSDVTVAVVVDGDRWATTDVASYVEESLDSDDVSTFRAPSREAAEQAIRDGEADGFVVINEELTRGVIGGKQQSVAVGLEGHDRDANDEVLTALGHALVAAPLKLFRAASGAEPLPPEGPIELETSYVYGGEEYDALDHVMPALLGFAAFLGIFTVGVVAFTGERIEHTLERLMATALRRSELMLGYTLGYSAISLVQAGAILMVAFLILRVHHAGNLGVVFLLIVITALAALSMAILLSAFARTEQQAMQMLPLVLVPQFVLSGVLFPIEILPRSLEVIGRFLPMTYSVNALRDVMIKDQGLFDAGVASNVAVLLAFAALFIVLGGRTVRREVA